MTRSTMALKLWLSLKGCGWEDKPNLPQGTESREAEVPNVCVTKRAKYAYKGGGLMTSEDHGQCFGEHVEGSVGHSFFSSMTNITTRPHDCPSIPLVDYGAALFRGFLKARQSMSPTQGLAW